MKARVKVTDLDLGKKEYQICVKMNDEQVYKESLQPLETDYLENLRDACLDSVRLINEVLVERELNQYNLFKKHKREILSEK